MSSHQWLPFFGWMIAIVVINQKSNTMSGFNVLRDYF
jgi:hypothetical protein